MGATSTMRLHENPNETRRQSPVTEIRVRQLLEGSCIFLWRHRHLSLSVQCLMTRVLLWAHGYGKNLWCLFDTCPWRMPQLNLDPIPIFLGSNKSPEGCLFPLGVDDKLIECNILNLIFKIFRINNWRLMVGCMVNNIPFDGLIGCYGVRYYLYENGPPVPSASYGLPWAHLNWWILGPLILSKDERLYNFESLKLNCRLFAIEKLAIQFSFPLGRTIDLTPSKMNIRQRNLMIEQSNPARNGSTGYQVCGVVVVVATAAAGWWALE